MEEQTESAKSTETISEPMQLIPIEEVPAGAVKKAEEAAPSTQPAEEKEKPVAVEKHKIIMWYNRGYVERNL